VLLTVAILAWFPGLLLAQHSHGAITPAVTFPKDDAVLLEQPPMLTLSFRYNVQLLQFALYTGKGEWIDLGFEWDPGQIRPNFVFPIPSELPAAEYFIARWSVVDEDQRFLKGVFNFAFGPEALPPSEIIEASISRREDGDYGTPFEAYKRRQQELEEEQP